jgi:hypothetical protein
LVVYVAVVRWTAEGFYDFAAVGPLIVCATALYERRGLAALLWYCVAAFIHFRVFLFAPWAVAAAVLVVRQRPWLDRRWQTWVSLGAIVILATLSLYVFALNWPSHKLLPADNPVTLAAHPPRTGAITVFLATWGLGVALFLAMRAWLDAVVAAWFVVMLLLTRQVFPWHILIPLAWLAAPLSHAARIGFQRVALVKDARLALLLFTSVQIYASWQIPHG